MKTQLHKNRDQAFNAVINALESWLIRTDPLKLIPTRGYTPTGHIELSVIRHLEHEVDFRNLPMTKGEISGKTTKPSTSGRLSAFFRKTNREFTEIFGEDSTGKWSHPEGKVFRSAHGVRLEFEDAFRAFLKIRIKALGNDFDENQ